MRNTNPQDAKDFWLNRFLRVVLVRRPALRWKLDYDRIDSLYLTCPDPIVAAHRYLTP